MGKIVRLLLAKDNLKLDVTSDGFTCLHNACKISGSEDSVKAFIKDKRCTPDILNRLSPKGITALVTAVIGGHLDVVKILVEKPETDCETGNPLEFAIENNLLEIVEVLLIKNNPKLKIEFQETFEDFGLIKACAENYLEVVQLLVTDERLTPEILSLKNGLGDTALMTAVVYKNEAGQNALDLAKRYRPDIAMMMSEMMK